MPETQVTTTLEGYNHQDYCHHQSKTVRKTADLE
ncbi:hypothetical protein A2U01_0085780, partial [Trifolium medium]|nr:hypothetical protein [Trifolium medium]